MPLLTEVLATAIAVCMEPSADTMKCCSLVKTHHAGCLAGTQSPGQIRKTWTSAGLREAYLSETVTPTQIATNAVKHIVESQKANPAMKYFTACDVRDVLQQAEQSTIRCDL